MPPIAMSVGPGRDPVIVAISWRARSVGAVVITSSCCVVIRVSRAGWTGVSDDLHVPVAARHSKVRFEGDFGPVGLRTGYDPRLLLRLQIIVRRQNETRTSGIDDALGINGRRGHRDEPLAMDRRGDVVRNDL